ncbi:NAD(P)-dependent oxidoreductase [Brevibacillus ruminantium]|uniref:NAD(P)-dependent oxidoreductase n=1 Tax=Brevibacillus ruminantium TaxID=2950604 RepID=A0ABY4WRY2_9BACL|nr:NAD(P)-dependent oxidoreductase [Brevibacillus ruminantium]USG68194.1 NAD(P)-dependent oxidoreductase [Brevibacillus ruminantium]
MKQVGFIGIGVMGKGMIANLLQKGHRVYAYDASAEALRWAKEQGAQVVHSPAELGPGAQIVFSSLPGPEIVEEVMLGENGLFATLAPDSMVFDTSTIDPATAQKLYAEAKQRGFHFFDCPVSGGPAGAKGGTLTIMVGGDSELLPAAMPYLQAIGRDIVHIGDAGSGQVAKLCHNAVVASITAALGEALLVARKAGVDPQKVASVIESGSAHNRVLSIFGPNILYGTYSETIFSLAHMHKDLKLYEHTARKQQVPSFVGSTVFQLYEAAMAQGKGGWDSSAVCTVIEQLGQDSIAR